MARPRAHLRGELRMPHDQRTDQRAADRIGRRPVGRVILRQPALPRGQQLRRELAPVARDHFDADRLRFEMAVDDQRVGQFHGFVNRPRATVIVVGGSRQRPHRGGADVIEAEIAGAAEVAARVELAAGPRQPLQFADDARFLGRRRRHCSFLRMKHFK